MTQPLQLTVVLLLGCKIVFKLGEFLPVLAGRSKRRSPCLGLIFHRLLERFRRVGLVLLVERSLHVDIVVDGHCDRPKIGVLPELPSGHRAAEGRLKHDGTNVALVPFDDRVVLPKVRLDA